MFAGLPNTAGFSAGVDPLNVQTLYTVQHDVAGDLYMTVCVHHHDLLDVLLKKTLNQIISSTPFKNLEVPKGVIC